MKRLLIIGAGGHGKVIAGIALACGYDTVAFLDDNTQLKTCMGYPVIGKTEDIFLYQKEDVFVAIGNPSVRQKIQNELEWAKYVYLAMPLRRLLHISAR